jgi:hypothetical protein
MKDEPAALVTPGGRPSGWSAHSSPSCWEPRWDGDTPGACDGGRLGASDGEALGACEGAAHRKRRSQKVRPRKAVRPVFLLLLHARAQTQHASTCARRPAPASFISMAVSSEWPHTPRLLRTARRPCRGRPPRAPPSPPHDAPPPPDTLHARTPPSPPATRRPGRTLAQHQNS